jgi:hypothetical protein
MSKRMLLALASGMLAVAMVAAQTPIPPGPVSGIWDLPDSPYLVEGEITVPVGEMLIIEPGVEVEFQGHYKLIVNGYLEAVGMVGDSIHFTAADPGIGWHGIRFINAQDSSHLFYCIIQHGRALGSEPDPDSWGGGILCHGSNPVIAHSAIRSNYAQWYAGGIEVVYSSSPVIFDCDIINNSAYQNGGIDCYSSCNPVISYCNILNNTSTTATGGLNCSNNSSPTISNCVISGNTAGWAGGGMLFYTGSHPVVTNCTVTGNSAGMSGGGIRISTNADATITGCTINGNTAGNYGGGISSDEAAATINTCVISGNTSAYDGGGVECYASNMKFGNCTITGNTSGGYGGGVDFWDSPTATMVNTIVEGNFGNGGVGFYNSSFVEITYSDFNDNENGDFSGSPPAGLGVIVGVNANGDDCDAFMNIFLDALFVVPGTDFHLDDWSPCIGAGDPATPPGFDIEGNPRPNPGGSNPDIGAYEHERPVPLAVELTTFEAIAGDGEVTLHWRTESETNNDHFMLYKRVAGNEDFGVLAQIPGQGTTSTPHEYEFVDRQVVNGVTYEYQISDVDINGVETIHDLIVSATPFSGASVPTEYALHQNYPNPFNPYTTISYDVKEHGFVTLKVFDVLGREVVTLVDGSQDASPYSVEFDATDLASGIYFYQLKVNDFTDLKKMVVLK